MAIRGQPFDVQLGAGLDTFRDEKRVLPGRLTRLENAVFDRGGRLTKRPGYVALGTDGLPSDPAELIVRRGALHVVGGASDPGLATYHAATDDWIGEDTAVTAPGSRERVLTLSGDSVIGQVAETLSSVGVDVDSAHAAGHVAYAASQNDLFHYLVVEEATGSIVAYHKVIASNAARVRVATDGTRFWFLEGVDESAGSNGELYYRVIDPSAAEATLRELPTLHTATMTVTPDANAPNAIELVSGSGEVAFVYSENSTSHLTIARIAAPGGALIENTGSTIDGESAAAFWSGSAYHVAAHDPTAAKFIVTAYVVGTGWSGAVQLANPSAPDNARHFGICTYDTSPLTVFVCVTYDDGSGNLDFSWAFVSGTTTLQVETGDPANTGALTDTGYDLSGHPFFYSGQVYIPLALASASQPKDLLVTLTRLTVAVVKGRGFRPHAILAQDDSPGWRPAQLLPRWASPGTGRFRLPWANVLESQDSTETFGVRYTEVALGSAAEPWQQVENRGAAYVTGGQLQVMTDRLAPNTPVLAPQILSLTEQSTGGQMTDGDYSYIAVYEYIDNEGQLHRSQPSPSTSVTLSAGTGTSSVDIALRDNRLQQFPEESTYRVMIYRTAADASGVQGTVYHLTAISDGPDTAITDGRSNSDLQTNALLTVQQGGTLEPVPLPGCSAVALWNGRMWAVPATRRSQVWPSKLLVAGRGPEFPADLVIDASGEPVTALAEFGNALLVFRERSVEAIYGEGPDNNGEGGDFSRLTPVVQTLGAVDGASVVTFPGGVAFRSRRGYRVLSAGMQVMRGQDGTELGSEVDAYADATVRSATLMRDDDRIVWLIDHASIDAVVFDVRTGQWATWVLSGSISALRGVDLAGAHVIIDSDGSRVLTADGSSFADAGAHVPMLLETGWISLAGVEGFQRCRRAVFSVEQVSACGYSVDVETELGTQTRTWSEAEVAALTRDSLEVHIKRQKSTRVRFRLQDTAPASSPGESYRIAGIQLEIAAKGPRARLPAVNRR